MSSPIDNRRYINPNTWDAKAETEWEKVRRVLEENNQQAIAAGDVPIVPSQTGEVIRRLEENGTKGINDTPVGPADSSVAQKAEQAIQENSAKRSLRRARNFGNAQGW